MTEIPQHIKDSLVKIIFDKYKIMPPFEMFGWTFQGY